MDDVDGTQPATSVAHSASMLRDMLETCIFSPASFRDWRLPFALMLVHTSWVHEREGKQGDVLAVTFRGGNSGHIGQGVFVTARYWKTMTCCSLKTAGIISHGSKFQFNTRSNQLFA